MSSNPGGSGVVEHLKNARRTTFLLGVGLGLVMPLGQFPTNVGVGLLASVRVSYYGYMPVTCSVSYAYRCRPNLTPLRVTGCE